MTTTVTPRPDSEPGLGGPRESTRAGRLRRALANRPTSAAELARWLRAVLDRPLTSYHLVLGAVALLLVVGVMMVLSASSVNAYVNYGDSYYYVKRQLLFLGIGVVGAVVIMKLPTPTLRGLGWTAVALAAVLLILTYTPLGISVNGNRNWLEPRLLDVLAAAGRVRQAGHDHLGANVLARKQRLLDQPRHLLVPFLPVSGLLILLVVFQGDAGTAVVMAGIVVGMLWIVGAPLAGAGRPGCGRGRRGGRDVRHVAGPDAAARGVPRPEHQRRRHQRPGQRRHVRDRLRGLVGRRSGRQPAEVGSLPEAHTDFIFAVLGEEFGLLGSLMVLALFRVLGYAGVRIAVRSDDPFARYAAGGVTSWFMAQGLFNLAVVLRLLPVAGVPLPMVSYGGSALIANLLAVGVLLGCARREPDARRMLARRSRRPAPRMTTVTGSRTAPPVPADERPLAPPGRWRHRRAHLPPDRDRARAERPAAGVRLTAVGTARGLETTVIPAAGLAAGADPAGADAPAAQSRPGAGRPPAAAGGAGAPSMCCGGWGPRRCSASAATCPPRPTSRLGGSACRSWCTSRTPARPCQQAGRTSDPPRLHVLSDDATPARDLHRAADAARHHRARPGWGAGTGPCGVRPPAATPVLLVSGGSQGAAASTCSRRRTRRCWPRGISVLHVLGPKNLPRRPCGRSTATGGRLRAGRLRGADGAAYAVADLMLGRCGAGTVMETAAVGLPAVYVPYPHGNGEQARNAELVVDAGAACCWPTRTARRTGSRVRSRPCWRIRSGCKE